MRSDSAHLSQPEKAPACGAWPWQWSGWEEAFAAGEYTVETSPRLSVSGKDGKWLFLTAEELHRVHEKLKKDAQSPVTQGKTHWDYLDTQLLSADGIWVDFFPDEISGWSWDQIRNVASKMFFLPPMVKTSKPTGSTRTQQLLVSDVNFQGFAPPQPEPIDKRTDGLSYTPLAINPACFEKVFDFVTVQNLDDVGDILNAPAWALQCHSPQAEQALYSLAQKHHIKVSFWEHAYSSPLRYLAGYEDTFNACIDPSTRARLKRTRSGIAPAKPLSQEPTLEAVKAQLGYAHLGLAGEKMDFFFGKRLATEHGLLPQKVADHLKDSLTFLPLAIAAERLGEQKATYEKDSLYARTWKVLVTCLLCAGDTDARRSWYYALCRYPAETLAATAELLNTAQELKIPILDSVKVILQAILYYQIEAQKVKPLLDYLKQTENHWRTGTTGAWGWEVKALICLAEGGNPTTVLPPEHREGKGIKDIQLIYGAQLLRQGNPEGTAIIKNELEKKNWSEFGWSVALRALFDTGGPIFDEFIEKTVNAQNAGQAAVVCNEFSACSAGDKSWREKHLAALASLTKKIFPFTSASPITAVMQLCFRAVLGEKESLAHYTAHRATYGAAAGVFLSTIYLLTEDTHAAREALDMAGNEPSDDYFLALRAVLNYILGRKGKAWELFDELKKANAYFWQPSFMSPRGDMIMFMLGILGKASGDDEMTAYALERLDIPAWEDRRTGIHRTAKMPGVEILDSGLRQWILRK